MSKYVSDSLKKKCKKKRRHNDVNIRYIKSAENPADIASRGVTLEKLTNNDLWWQGPSWLGGGQPESTHDINDETKE